MLEPEICALRNAMLGVTTNSDSQATRWAREIIERLDKEGYSIRAREIENTHHNSPG